MTVLNVIDSFEYVKANCFQHQLFEKMNEMKDVETRELVDVLDDKTPGDYSHVVLCLKQRTIDRNLKGLSRSLGTLKVNIYDQDPWAAFTDDSPFKGSYTRMMNELNVETFALTTKWWVDYLKSKGMPSLFVRMGLLPRYCHTSSLTTNRAVPIGFAGTTHPYRKTLFDFLASEGLPVWQHKSVNYDDYLFLLSGIESFVHSEDAPIVIDGEKFNLNVGLWIKDIEATARGCFSFRNAGPDADTYLEGIPTAFQYEDVSELPEMLRTVQRMSQEEKLNLTKTASRIIREQDRWQETAELLTMYSGPCESRVLT